MKSDLIIITREYPFGKNETFLESEIPVISKYFRKIIIFPTINSDTKRSVPENVSINNLIFKDYKNSLKWIFVSIFSFSFYFDLFKYIFKSVKKKKVLSLFKYCISKNIFLYKSKIIVNNYRSSLIYFYWYSAFVDAITEIKENDMKVVTRVHGGDLYEDFSPIGFFPNRNFSISKINRIFTISNHGKNHLLEKFNINNVSVSKLGVISKNVISNSSNKFNFSVVSVSNIIPSKRVILIAHSIMQFSIENPNICVLWNHFGDGSDEKILKNLVNKCGIKNLKISLNGKVSNFEIFNFYANFSVDVLLNLSISEGIPVSMMEAISFGIPLIGTNVGGVSEIINSNTGLLLNDNPTIQIVVEALQSVYLNPPNRETIYNFYNSNFNGTNNYQKFALDLIEIHKSK